MSPDERELLAQCVASGQLTAREYFERVMAGDLPMPNSPSLDPVAATVSGDRKRVLFWAARRGGFLHKNPQPALTVRKPATLGYGHHNPFKRAQTILDLVDAGLIEAFSYQPNPARPAEIRYRATPAGLDALARSRQQGDE